MTSTFMALQCFKCSTMQVKQRKKSSNKWICVICNEKQSVRKIYFQAFMAKDVRAFVQKFNMSRQFVEQQHDLQQEEDLTTDYDQHIQPNTKRTDWSEYVDEPQHTGIDYDQGDLCEPNVVTELPKPLFKKPKLTDHYSSSGFDSEKLRKPVFGKRTGKNKSSYSDKEPTTFVKESFQRGVGENQFDHDGVDHSSVYQRSSSVMSKFQRPNSKSNAWKYDNGTKVDKSFAYTGGATSLKKPVSKWNDFIDDDLQLQTRSPGINNDVFETTVSDEIVEDDVHPDFL